MIRSVPPNSPFVRHKDFVRTVASPTPSAAIRSATIRSAATPSAVIRSAAVRFTAIFFVAVFFATLFFSITGFAQGSRTDYERAAAIESRFQGKVFNESLYHQWLGEGARGWYAVENPGDRREYFLFDPDSDPVIRPLFDHTRLAAALAAASGQSVDPAALPNRNTYVDSALTAIWFRAFDRNWRVDLATYTVTEEPKPSDSSRSEIRNVRGERPSPRENLPKPPEDSFAILYELFIRDHNLWARNRQSRREWPLTGDGNSDDRYLEDWLWSPDGQKVVVFRETPEQTHRIQMVESSPQDQLQPKLREVQYLKPGDRISVRRPVLFDFTLWMEQNRQNSGSDETTGHPTSARREIATTLFPNPWSTDFLRWSPDSKEFFLLYNQRGHQIVRILAVRGDTGDVRVVVNEERETFFDYAFRLFHEFSPDATELVWMSDRDDWNHLYRIDVASGTVKRQITSGKWLVRNVERIDWEKRQVLFRCVAIHPEQDPYYYHFALGNLDTGETTILTEGDGTHTIEWSPDGRYFIDTWSRVDLAPIHELRTATGSLVTVLAQSDSTALVAEGWIAPQRFCAKGRDDTTDIYGVIWRPTNFDPQKRYPVIENIYAGPQDFYTPKSFHAYYRAQSLAELGFFVVQCDGMGTNWRSKRFLDVCWKNLADAGFPDRKRWITAAAKFEPAMDLSRVGIYGGSAGGQNAVAALLWHHDFYHVAVADCGCHDNRMDKIWWNELWMSWPIGPHYAANSNTVNAHRLEGKLLLFVGELDENVDPASTFQLVDALIRADKDFDLIVIPGAGHGCAESTYGTRRRMDYFVRNLWGMEPRAH